MIKFSVFPKIIEFIFDVFCLIGESIKEHASNWLSSFWTGFKDLLSDFWDSFVEVFCGFFKGLCEFVLFAVAFLSIIVALGGIGGMIVGELEFHWAYVIAPFVVIICVSILNMMD